MKKKYSRYQFLKAVGFTGPALMAVLSSCTQNEDFNVDSLVLNSSGETVPDLSSTVASNTPTAPISPTTPTTPITPGTTVNALAKIDLTSSAASNLKNPGGYIIVSNMYVVGKTSNGDYVAASNLCTHEPKRRIILNKTEFYCTDHGARFSLTGQTLTTIARTNLTVYKTAVDGNILTVY
jgi:nitrite reductase/ring-hydroxylating ferredoxin subunit